MFKQGIINYSSESSEIQYIVFAEPTKSAKTKMYALMGKAVDDTLTVEEAAALTSLGSTTWDGDQNIGSFNEFEYFTGIKTIPSSLFRNSTITSFRFPSSITGVLGTSMFEGCHYLTSLGPIPEGVTDVQSRFVQYASLTEIHFPSTLINIGAYCFQDDLFKTINIPAACRSIGVDTLSRQLSVRAVILKAGLISGVGCSYNNSFYTLGDSSTRLYVPADAVSWYKASSMWSAMASKTFAIGNWHSAIGGDLRYHIGEELYISSTVMETGSINGTDILTIRDMLINGILSSLDLSGASIIAGGSAYYDTNTTSANVIGNNMFRDCINLTSIKFKSGITSVGTNVFTGCPSLTSITLYATTPPLLSSPLFYDRTFTGVIYVPSATVNAYKVATNWAEYANNIFAIPS